MEFAALGLLEIVFLSIVEAQRARGWDIRKIEAQIRSGWKKSYEIGRRTAQRALRARGRAIFFMNFY